METSNPNIRKLEIYSTLGLNTKFSTETPQTLTLLASVLEQTIHKNEKFLKRSRKKDGVTIFHGSRVASLSIRLYIDRIFKYSKCSPSCFVAAYIYMERFLEDTNGYLTSLNAHRLLIACVLVAAKFLEDVCFDNAYYAKIGGVSTTELNKLELKLLFSLNFRLHVTVETFDHYCLLLAKEGTGSRSRVGSKGHIEPKCTSKLAACTCRYF